MSQSHFDPNIVISWPTACYSVSNIPFYAGNPLIDALPSINSEQDTYRQLQYFPEFRARDRMAPDHERFHYIYNLGTFFRPLSIHLNLESRISIMLRSGYKARNPVQKNYYRNLSDKKSLPDMASKRSPSFYIVGMSGVGKSTGVEQILKLYPQVLRHTQYHGKPFNFFQIIWLKIDCPFDGSVTGLCLNIFQEIDQLLGTNYRKTLGEENRPNIPALLLNLRCLVRLHGIGCIVIDEIQQLSVAKGQGVTSMLNFFVNLVNDSEAPIILIGTPKALPLLRREFQQARRASGLGDLYWPPMENDIHLGNESEWLCFTDKLLEYQYVRQPTRESRESLSEALYSASAGIVDFAVKTFILAQFRAIETKTECLTKQLIASVASDSFSFANDILEKIRSRRFNELENIPDIGLFDLGNYYRDRKAREARESYKQILRQEKSTLVVPPASEVPIVSKPRTKRKILPQNDLAQINLTQSDLRYVFSKAQKVNLSMADELRTAGYIKNVSEFTL